jgi:ADP-ribosylglycohydrolase
MALCLANSLLARRDFIPYDQLVRYKWWSKYGYMSSTGHCFDIGAATSISIHEFTRRQKVFAKEKELPLEQLDYLSDVKLLNEFDVYCSDDDAAGNGALMRLAPVPLFFFRNKYAAVEFSGRSGQITHGDKKAYDACRFYGALIVAALRGWKKEQILASNFYSERRHWFGDEPLDETIIEIAKGSYKKLYGYEGGIRGKGYIVSALEAALWAFWSDDCSFEKGALAAVNLGDDTDTTAAIYGQLAGAYYGYKKLPEHWLKHVYALKFMKTLSKWIAYEGEQWDKNRENSFIEESRGRH